MKGAEGVRKADQRVRGSIARVRQQAGKARSNFPYVIKAARYAARARWRPKAADAPVYRPALGSPRQLSAQGQASGPTEPAKQRPARSSTTRSTPRQRPSQLHDQAHVTSSPGPAESAVTAPRQSTIQASATARPTQNALSSRGSRWLGRPASTALPTSPTRVPRRARPGGHSDTLRAGDKPARVANERTAP